jgi:hypothetical protein
MWTDMVTTFAIAVLTIIINARVAVIILIIMTTFISQTMQIFVIVAMNPGILILAIDAATF